jgi:hypothetical protein
MQEARKLKNSEKIKALKEFLNSGRNKPFFTAEELTEGILNFLHKDRLSASMENKVADMIYNAIQNYRGCYSDGSKLLGHHKIVRTVIKRIKNKHSIKIDVDNDLSVYLKDSHGTDSTLIYGGSGRTHKVIAEVVRGAVVVSLVL